MWGVREGRGPSHLCLYDYAKGSYKILLPGENLTLACD
jgi:hypothetical protein